MICLSTSCKLKKGHILIFFSAWTKWRVIAIYNESEWWMKSILCNSHWGVKVRLLYIEEMCIYHFLFYEHMFNVVKWFLMVQFKFYVFHSKFSGLSFYSNQVLLKVSKYKSWLPYYCKKLATSITNQRLYNSIVDTKLYLLILCWT